MKAFTCIAIAAILWVLQYVVFFGVIYHGYITQVPTTWPWAAGYWITTFILAAMAAWTFEMVVTIIGSLLAVAGKWLWKAMGN